MHSLTYLQSAPHVDCLNPYKECNRKAMNRNWSNQKSNQFYIVTVLYRDSVSLSLFCDGFFL